MSLLVTTDISCDGEDCLEWVSGYSGLRVNGEVARVQARQSGWMQIRHEGRMIDLCPDCYRTVTGKAPRIVHPPLEPGVRLIEVGSPEMDALIAGYSEPEEQPKHSPPSGGQGREVSGEA